VSSDQIKAKALYQRGPIIMEANGTACMQNTIVEVAKEEPNAFSPELLSKGAMSLACVL
jgi:hypothetical protein